MVLAANTVNAANPNLLIFFAGLDSDITIYPIPTGSNLGDGVKFIKSDFAYADKLVLELHNYMSSTFSCDVLELYLYKSGFNALNADDSAVVNVMPVVMTEFGYAQDQSDVDSIYATCLKSYLPSQQAGWMVWTVAGSYYIRSGVQDSDETYGEYRSIMILLVMKSSANCGSGILNHQWSDYRNETIFEQGVAQLIAASLS